MMLIDDVARALEGIGLELRGGFAADGHLVPCQDGRQFRTVLLVGSAGPAMWQRFAAERPPGANPLDTWTRAVLTPVAQRFGARAVFPFEPPFLPFQQWLMRAEPCHLSPLGIVIHPRYGLWHALRGALLFAEEIGLPETVPPTASPCESCADRPCLTTCPVVAFSGTAYDVARCLGQLSGPAGEDCVALGCRARRACPVGSGYRYAPPQARFHMEAFRQAISRQLTRTVDPCRPRPPPRCLEKHPNRSQVKE
jgi:Fe-S-cluster-containing hydrogenase component 2